MVGILILRERLIKMKTHLFKIECLTNLHVGSGDLNYNIIDNEVEKDPSTMLPIIHASGVKGALREHLTGVLTDTALNRIFGKPSSQDSFGAGSCKFFDARMLSRPMRVADSYTMASIPVVTAASVNDFLRQLNVFGCNPFGVDQVNITREMFGDKQFLTNVRGIRIEGEPTGKIPEEIERELLKLKCLLGETFAIAGSFQDYDLPVLARNCLENGESKNLWYEEVVPHGSVFWLLVMMPEEERELNMTGIVQFGGNASIGCGFTRVMEITEGEHE